MANTFCRVWESLLFFSMRMCARDYSVEQRVAAVCVFECVYARSARSQLRVGVCVRTLSLWTRKMTKTKIIKNYFPQFSNRCASEHNHLYCSLKTILYLFRWYWLWLCVQCTLGWLDVRRCFVYLSMAFFISCSEMCARIWSGTEQEIKKILWKRRLYDCRD